MISQACRTLSCCRTRAGFAVVENVSATRWTCRMVIPSRSNHNRKRGTHASPEPSQQERVGREGNNGQRERKIVDLDEPTTTDPYALPPATWSLSDLNVNTDDEEATETARAVLSPQEVGILWTRPVLPPNRYSSVMYCGKASGASMSTLFNAKQPSRLLSAKWRREMWSVEPRGTCTTAVNLRHQRTNCADPDVIVVISTTWYLYSRSVAGFPDAGFRTRCAQNIFDLRRKLHFNPLHH